LNGYAECSLSSAKIENNIKKMAIRRKKMRVFDKPGAESYLSGLCRNGKKSMK